jgi:hypothetical protein
MANALQSVKYVNVTPPAAIIDNASATTNSVNTEGFAYATFLVELGATDIALTALKLQESDTDGSYADIVGARFGTDADATGTTSTLPSATDDNKVYAIFVDLKGRKKYLDLVITFGDGTNGGFVASQCILSGADIQPHTAAGLGLGQYLVV